MTITDPDPSLTPEAPQRRLLARLALILVPLVVVLLVAEMATRQWVDPLHYLPSTQRYDPFVEQHVARMATVRDKLDDKAIDVVVSGTSVVAVSLDPAIVGPASGASVYNAAVGCGNIEIQSEWLPNWVAEFAAPKNVVIGINPGDFDAAACVRGWDDRETYDDTSFSPDWELFKVSSLWRQRKFLAEQQNWKVFWESNEEEPFWTIDVNENTGFWDVLSWRSDIDIETFLINQSRTTLVVDDIMTKSLATAITELRAQGINVIVAEIPMGQRFADNLEAGRNFEDVLVQMENIATENGATYLPADLRFRENGLYIDGSHMTPDGAEQFSQWFGEQLVDLLED